MNRARSLGSLVAVALAALLVASACGSTAPTAPPGSPAPGASGASANPTAATATSTPVGSAAVASSAPSSTEASPGSDVVTPFLATISEPGFRANATVSGTVVVAAVTSPVAGTYDLAGSDYGRSLKIGAGSKVGANGFKVASSTAYASTGNGPWFEAPYPAAGTDLGSVLRSVKSVDEIGLEAKNGRQLHHLAATGVTLPPAVLGLTDATIKDVTGKLDFWVSDDGKPQVVAATGTWIQKSGKDPAAVGTMAVEFALTNVGGSVSVTAPDRVWKQMKSKKYRYAMAYPTDWEFKKASGKKIDRFYGPEYANVFVSSDGARGFSLNLWVKGYLQVTPKLAGLKAFKLQSNKAATLAGSRARRLEFKDTYKGDKEYWTVVLTVHGGRVYDVSYGSSKPLTKADRELFDQFLATFHFG